MGKSSFGNGRSFAEATARLREAIDAGSLTMAPAYGNAHATEYPDFTQQVNAGAAWLDQQLPGWDELIDVTRLDLDDHDQCVLGQTWHHYAAAHALMGTGENNFSDFLVTAVSTQRVEGIRFAQAHGFALTEEAYVWNQVESERRVQTGELTNAIRMFLDRNDRYALTARLIDRELWQQLTRTWLVLIEARHTVRARRTATMLA